MSRWTHPPKPLRRYEMPGETDRVEKLRAEIKAKDRRYRAAFSVILALFAVLLTGVVMAMIAIASR